MGKAAARQYLDTTRLMNEAELAQQSRDFLSVFTTAVGTDERLDANGPIWGPVREFLARITESRARQGFSPDRDRDVRVLAEGASVQPVAQRIQGRRGDRGRDLEDDAAPGPLGL